MDAVTKLTGERVWRSVFEGPRGGVYEWECPRDSENPPSPEDSRWRRGRYLGNAGVRRPYTLQIPFDDRETFKRLAFADYRDRTSGRMTLPALLAAIADMDDVARRQLLAFAEYLE